MNIFNIKYKIKMCTIYRLLCNNKKEVKKKFILKIFRGSKN